MIQLLTVSLQFIGTTDDHQKAQNSVMHICTRILLLGINSKACQYLLPASHFQKPSMFRGIVSFATEALNEPLLASATPTIPAVITFMYTTNLV